MDDENTQDFTVYDLAERMAGGMTLSSAAHQEVHAERERVQKALSKLSMGPVYILERYDQKREGQALLDLRVRITELLASMNP